MSGNAEKLDLRLTEPTSSGEVVAAIAQYLGMSVSGDPGSDEVAPNLLHQVSVAKALSTLLPRQHFAIRFEGAPPVPKTIIFRKPPSPPHASVTIVAPPSGDGASEPANIPVPEENRDEFVKTLPMLKTR